MTPNQGRGLLAVLRRAKNIPKASEAERCSLLEDAEGLENWCAVAVVGGVALEAVVNLPPLLGFPAFCQLIERAINFSAGIAVAAGVLGELRFGNVAGAVLKTQLSEALDRAAAAEKELALVKKGFGQRRLEMESFIAALKDKTPAPVQVVYQAEDSAECLILAMDIWSGLKRAGWEVESPVPFVRDRVGKYQHVAAAVSVGGLPTDVTVVVRTRDEWDRPGTAFETLVAALKVGLPLFPLGAGEFPELVEGELRIVVAPKA